MLIKYLKLCFFSISLLLPNASIADSQKKLLKNEDFMSYKVCNPTDKQTNNPALTTANNRVIEIGKIYKHYSGKLYKVLAISHYSENPETLYVIYEALYDCPTFGKNATWARPYDMFAENVIINDQEVARFAEVSKEFVTQQSYTKLAKTRNDDKGDMDFWQPEFEEFKRLLPSGRVIDIGCGTGRDALLFTNDSNYEYVGIDLSEEMLEQARLLVPQADFRQMNMYHLDFQSNSFDGFWASTSLLHIPKSRIDEALGEIKRILKPASIGFIVLKDGEGEDLIQRGDDIRFFALYTEQEFRSVLEHNGFKILTAKTMTHSKSGSQKWVTFFVELN